MNQVWWGETASISSLLMIYIDPDSTLSVRPSNHQVCFWLCVFPASGNQFRSTVFSVNVQRLFRCRLTFEHAQGPLFWARKTFYRFNIRVFLCMKAYMEMCNQTNNFLTFVRNSKTFDQLKTSYMPYLLIIYFLFQSLIVFGGHCPCLRCHQMKSCSS